MNEEQWREMIPEELRDKVSKFDSLEGLVKGYTELESYQGQSLRIPGENSSVADQQKFYDKVMERVPGLVRKPVEDDKESVDNFWQSMGKPAEIDGYAELEGMTPEQTEFMRKAAYDANMTNEQFRKFAGMFTERQIQEKGDFEARTTAELEGIYQELGIAKDKKLQAVDNLASQLDMDESLRNFKDPKVLRLMLKLVDKVGSEGSQMQTQLGSEGSAVMTPVEAEAQLAEIFNNSDHDFFHPERPGNAMAKLRVLELQSYASPGASTSMASQRAGAAGTMNARDTLF